MTKRSTAYWATTALVGAATLSAAFSYLTTAPDALENFRRQDRVNVALMACVQSLAAEHARLRLRVASLEAGADASEAPAAGDAPAGR